MTFHVTGRMTPEANSNRRCGLAALQSYGLAVLSVAIAVGSALLLESPHFRDAAVPLLLFAVAITSWYSRTGPAVLAVVLSTISFYWYVVEPVRTPNIYPSQILYFVIICCVRLAHIMVRHNSAPRRGGPAGASESPQSDARFYFRHRYERGDQVLESRR